MATALEKQEQMFSLIDTWKASGQSQQAFCKTQNITYHAFHYWYKKWRTSQPVSSDFLPVNLRSHAPGAPSAELIFPDGRRVNFYPGADASLLRTLLS
jgi:hypothetical protein